MSDIRSKEKELQKVLLTPEIIKEILDALPITVAILNWNREILYANKVCIENEIPMDLSEFIGLRPGEAFSCMHFINSEYSCGDDKACKFCGTANVIVKAQNTGNHETSESRITRLINGNEVAQEFSISAKPVIINERKYIILSLLDISIKKRKRALERIFFHDILNKAGSLTGFFQLIKDDDNAHMVDELLDLAKSISEEMTDEIMGQKELMAAEEGELKVSFRSVNIGRILNTVKMQMSNLESHKNKEIILGENPGDLIINSDQILLKRILINMVKNALEASLPDQTVRMGAFIDKSENVVRLWVNNESYIPEYIQLQIFHRSFSTKGEDRGLGTYSIKLLGEKYLKGKVGFDSTEQDGTTFWIELAV